MAVQGTDFPLGGTVVTGGARDIYELVFGRSPQVDCVEDRAIADIRFSRRNHTSLTILARAFPITADSTQQKMARHRQLVSQAVVQVRVARMQMARAA